MPTQFSFNQTNGNVVSVKDYGAVGDGVTDDTSAIQAAFTASNNITFNVGATYYLTSAVTIAADDVNVNATGATFKINGSAGDTGFIVGSSATDSLPNHSGFRWVGGTFNNNDATENVARSYITISGVEDFEITDVEMNGVCNGGVLLRSGCKNGLIERVRIKSYNSNGSVTIRGIWLNGSDATDYQNYLIDERSITRNANALPVGGIKNITIRKCNIVGAGYGVYLMNSQNTTIEDNDIDIVDGATRNITINTYSPYTKVINNRLRSASTGGNKGILVTQYSHDVVIRDNDFFGDWGTSIPLHCTYKSEVQIINNTFICDNAIPIISEMGAHGKVSGNTFDKPIETAKTAGDRCMRIYTIGNAEVGTPSTQPAGEFGETATSLEGWVFENNHIKRRNGGVQLTQQQDRGASNEVGIEHVIVKGNTFYDWDDVSNSDEYPLKIASIVSPANDCYYLVENNITVPYSSGFEGRNRVDDPNGAALLLNHQGFTGSGSWTIEVTDGTGDPNEGQTYSTNVGSWTRVGDVVTFQGYFVMSSLGTLTTSNNVEIQGLPYTSKNTTDAYWSINVGYGTGLSITAGHALTGYVLPNTKEMRILKWSATTGTSNLLLSELTASGGLMISGTYQIEDLAQ